MHSAMREWHARRLTRARSAQRGKQSILACLRRRSQAAAPPRAPCQAHTDPLQPVAFFADRTLNGRCAVLGDDGRHADIVAHAGFPPCQLEQHEGLHGPRCS